MTDDDREGFKPESSAEDAGDPAAAFEALRRTIEKQGGQIGAEMTIIRRGVEAAFDKFEKYRQPPDYGPDLGKIIKFLAVVESRLEAVEQSPILRNGAEHYARALERSGEGLVRTAALELERRATDLEREAVNLAEHVAGVRQRHVQNRLLWIVGAAGVLAGVTLTLFLPAMLPGSVAPRVASFVMAERPWKAGMTLMEFANAEAWNRVVAADQLLGTNAAEVAACRETAGRTGEAQSCTITVPAPAAVQ